jgi:hypothetical protein
MHPHAHTHHHFVLRDLPRPARLVIAAFLISVGLGYASAMVQLHFQHASPGNPLPGPDDVIRHFHGDPDPKARVSPLVRLVETPEDDQPFNGSGSMAPAFTTRSSGWKAAIKKRPESLVRKEREGERQALALWLRGGPKKDEYDADRFPLPATWTDQPVTDEFLDGPAVKIKSLFTERCLRCHQKDGDDQNAAQYPLDTWGQIQKYSKFDPTPGAMSLEKLTQSTHVHLLGFAMLYALTGFVFAFTRYPAWLRAVLAPLVLVAQVADVSCWWLARLEGPIGVWFALAIMVTGGIVGTGLFLQIVLSLWDLFGKNGKSALVILFLVAAVAGTVVKRTVIDPRIRSEAEGVSAAAKPAAPEAEK